MKQFQSQLQRKAKTVSLTAAERRDIKMRLQTYMEYHPLPAELRTNTNAANKKQTSSLTTEAFTQVALPFKALFQTLGVAFAVVVLVIPFMAERAVPGETLYAVKVQFNEELRSTLTFSGVEKVEWETERLNRRIAEARLLASEGRLTDVIEAEVAAAVKEHSEKAQREIAELRTIDSEEAAMAAITFDTTLEAQSSALRSDETNVAVNEVDQSTELIADVINESLTVSKMTASTTPPSYEKLLARVEQNTTRIVELRDTVTSSVAAEQLAKIERRISDIDQLVTDAMQVADASNGDRSEARQLLIDALEQSQKLIVYMTELEVMETVDIETVVPVILTNEEKATKRAELSAALVEKRTKITAAIEAETDTGVIEKAALALKTIDAGISELASTTAYLTFVERATPLIELADDTIHSFEAAVIDVDAVAEPAIEPATTTATSSAAPSVTDAILQLDVAGVTSTATTSTEQGIPSEQATTTVASETE